MRKLTTIIMCLLLTVPALAQQVIIAKKKSTPSGVAVTDNFNRSSANPIGGNWSVPTGGAALQIVSDTYVTGTVDETVTNCSYWNADTFADNQYSQALLIDGDNAGVAVRMASGSLTGYVWIHATGDDFKLFKVVAGTWTQLGSTYSLLWSHNDTLRLEISGTTLTPYLNGDPQTTQTDSDIASGSPGIVARLDFPTLAQFDNWAGGDL